MHLNVRSMIASAALGGFAAVAALVSVAAPAFAGSPPNETGVTVPFASGQPLPFTNEVFFVHIKMPVAWTPLASAKTQSYVDGQPCSVISFIDGLGPGEVDAAFDVPNTCAYPGARVVFVVDGYVAHDAGTWGFGYSAITKIYASAFMQTTMIGEPAAQWGGTVFGVSPGATVEARINGQVCGYATTVASGPGFYRSASSRFQMTVYPASHAPYGMQNCGFAGARVDFYINNVKAKQSTTWQPGAHQISLSLY